MAANQAAITQSSISDTRADSSVCGLITQLIDQIDTSEFMQQLTTWQEEYAAEQQAAFSTWFEAMKDQLSEDAAGNLQLEIDNLSQSAEAHDYSIEQINEIIGDADMGTSDSTIRGAIREIIDKIGDSAITTQAKTIIGAINELLTRISGLNTRMNTAESNINTIRTHDNNQALYTKIVTLGTFNFNSAGAAESTVSVAAHVQSGYTLIGAIPRTTGTYSAYFYSCSTSGNSVWFQIMRAISGATSCSPSVLIICKRNL